MWRAFGDSVPLFLLILLVVSLTAYLIGKKRKLNSKRVIINVLFVLSILAVVFITVYPKYYGTSEPRIINLVPFIGMINMMIHSVDSSVPIRNIGLNLLLFIPFGFFLSLKVSRLNKNVLKNVVFKGFLLSFIVELIQYSFPMGRSADIDDLILNTFGALLGYVTWKLFNLIFSNKSLTIKTAERQL
nr:VanZ family protein [Metabacillus idriensis]